MMKKQMREGRGEEEGKGNKGGAKGRSEVISPDYNFAWEMGVAKGKDRGKRGVFIAVTHPPLRPQSTGTPPSSCAAAIVPSKVSGGCPSTLHCKFFVVGADRFRFVEKNDAKRKQYFSHSKQKRLYDNIIRFFSVLYNILLFVHYSVL
jgi:hypothetical protein